MTTKYQKQQKRYEEEKKKAENSPTRLDKKSIIYVVLFSFFIAIVCFAIMVDIRGYLIRHDPNWTVTIGQVQSIEEIIGMNQTKAGNRIEIIGYKIKYYYMVDSIGYEQEYIYGARKIDLRRFVGFVKPFDSIEIYYKKEDPKNSYINFNLNSEFYRNEKNE